MPSEFQHRARYCHPCEHLQRENVVYGHDFVRGNYVCHHPEAHDFGPLLQDPEKAAKQGEMRARLREHGRLISKHQDLQPEWCPLRRPPEPPPPIAVWTPPRCAVCGGFIRKTTAVRIRQAVKTEYDRWEHIDEKLSHVARPQ